MIRSECLILGAPRCEPLMLKIYGIHLQLGSRTRRPGRNALAY
jgi:hypothetical protein